MSHIELMQMGPGRILDISSIECAHGAVLPIIMFHISMVYAIMRKEGVSLGKRDFIESFIDNHVYNT